MTKFAPAALLAVLMLAGCGHHDHESDDATPSNVEMPAADLPAGPPSLAAPPPARDLALGLPTLVCWQLTEMRALLAR